MQSVAAEMNLAETAFPLPEGDGFRLRWFTPKVEVKLCGHATLATAHILWETGPPPAGPRGALPDAERAPDRAPGRRPRRARFSGPAAPSQAAGLGRRRRRGPGDQARLHRHERRGHPLRSGRRGGRAGVEPDFATLRSLPARGVIVTSRSADKRFDFVSRFFAPAVGVDEDPVTGLLPHRARALLGGTAGKDVVHGLPGLGPRRRPPPPPRRRPGQDRRPGRDRHQGRDRRLGGL